MKFVALAFGDNVILCAEEIKQLARAKSYSIKNQIVELEGEAFEYSRIAYSKTFYELLFVTTKSKIEDDVKKFDWEKHYKGSFRVDKHSVNFDLPYLGSLVGNQLKNPKVDLFNAKIKIEFLGSGNKILVCKVLYENDEKFSKRRPHLRPGFHPSSLQPKLARALVNLANVPEGGTVADPFCGTGGILIEAGLLGYKIVGSDISDEMIKMCKENMKSFKLKCDCSVADATKVKIKADAVVADPPYGLCSSLHKCDKLELYESFLKNAYKQLKKGSRVIIMFPNDAMPKHDFKVIAEVDQFIHGSLTRHITVLEKE